MALSIFTLIPDIVHRNTEIYSLLLLMFFQLCQHLNFIFVVGTLEEFHFNENTCVV